MPVTSLGSLESDITGSKAILTLTFISGPAIRESTPFSIMFRLQRVLSAPGSSNSITVDFGKEISGRLRVDSSSATAAHLQMSFGESLQEAAPDLSSLGPRSLVVPAGETAYGPVTGFRYVQVVFLDGPEAANPCTSRRTKCFRNLPVVKQYQNPDAQLVQIWQTSVYTAQLECKRSFGMRLNGTVFPGRRCLCERADGAGRVWKCDRFIGKGYA